MTKIALPIICALISGVVAVFVSNHQLMEFQVKQSKINTLNKIFGHRYVLYEDSCVTAEADRILFSALGEAAILFGNSKEVVGALENLRVSINADDFSESDLNKLHRAMMSDLGIQTSDYVLMKAPVRRSCGET
ncbi:hypothetical protein [Shewanella waksmanii]|uniref:hypothetical protein n=1 Tax=Shewanella waksmanii TaxID=213783 RepID=UPI0037369599